MELPPYIENMLKMSSQAKEEFFSVFKREELPKGHLIFHQGDICRHLFYIEKGMARLYYNSSSGKEITAWFSDDKTFLTAVDSFYQHKPTRDYCELLEDSIVYSIKYTDMEALMDKNPAMAKIVFHATYEIASKMSEFIANTKFKTAEERYNALLEQYPHIIHRASLGHIASFLGITQETLSRIRTGK